MIKIRRKYFICILACFAVAGFARAGLWDPPITNASFESQLLSGAWSQAVDDWYSNDFWGTFVESEEGSGIPDTDYGDNWGGLAIGDAPGMLYQPIGTWDPEMEYKITILCGQRENNDFGDIKVMLVAGAAVDDPALAGLLGLDSVTGGQAVAEEHDHRRFVRAGQGQGRDQQRQEGCDRPRRPDELEDLMRVGCHSGKVWFAPYASDLTARQQWAAAAFRLTKS